MFRWIKSILASKNSMWVLVATLLFFVVGAIAFKRPDVVKEVNVPWWMTIMGGFYYLVKRFFNRDRDE